MAMLAGIPEAASVSIGGKCGKLPAGGYVCKIRSVQVDQTRGGKVFVKLELDVAEGDYAGHFQRRFLADARSPYGQKWKGVYKIFLPVKTGDDEKYRHDLAAYQRQILAITRANDIPAPDLAAGYDPACFQGCTVGVLFREAEYCGNRFTEAAFLCDPEKIRKGDFEIPEPRQSKQTANNALAAAQQQPAAVPNHGRHSVLMRG